MLPDSNELTVLSSRLSRQIKRHLGILDGLNGINKSVLGIKSRIELTEEEAKLLLGFPDFLYSINTSYAESDEKNRMAVRNLEISSSELNLVNDNLEDLNQKINAMLDSLGQGLLFFDKNGQCSNVFSKACLDLFGVDPSRKQLKEILSKYGVTISAE
jgi:hypothetical protein